MKHEEISGLLEALEERCTDSLSRVDQIRLLGEGTNDILLYWLGRADAFQLACLIVRQNCDKPKEQKPIFRIGDTLKKKGKDYTFVVDRIQGGYYLTAKDAFFPIEKQDEWELVEQKPAEWSEEDEKDNLDILLSMVNELDSVSYSGGRLKLSDEKKKELKIFIESLRPSWKPSEEQMKALWNLMHNAVFLSSWGELEKQIESLYSDLKEL